MRLKFALPLIAAALSGCVSSAREERPPPVTAQPSAVSYTTHGLESVIGSNARALTGLLGQPGLDIHEGRARKLQFLGPACVLDTYLYPPRSGGEPVVTHVDARLPDGRDMDRASCVAALTAQQQTR
ncbi:MAG: hypothetical protein ACXW2T_09065 [Allosphingosinicella sp.]